MTASWPSLRTFVSIFWRSVGALLHTSWFTPTNPQFTCRPVHHRSLNIAVHMSPAAYSNGTVFSSGKSRYNELNIKVSTIDIVHRLDEAGLIGRKDGWQDSGGKGFLTRIWPTPKLTKLFEDAAFGFFDICYAENRETIILRDEDKVDAPYDDNRMVMTMRLSSYGASTLSSSRRMMVSLFSA